MPNRNRYRGVLIHLSTNAVLFFTETQTNSSKMSFKCHLQNGVHFCLTHNWLKYMVRKVLLRSP